MQQKSRGHLAIGRIFLDQCPGREDRGFVDFLDRNPVVEVLERFLQDRRAVHEFPQALAGRFDRCLQLGKIQRLADPAFSDVQCGSLGRRLIDFVARTLLRAAFAVQHIGTSDIVFARAHEREFDGVLDIFDMKRAAVGATANQRADNLMRQRVDDLAHARRSGTLTAVDGQEGLGHGDADLAGLEVHDRAVAADDVVLRPRVLSDWGGL